MKVAPGEDGNEHPLEFEKVESLQNRSHRVNSRRTKSIAVVKALDE